MTLKKTQTHGKIGEAAVAAKCWMHGIPAYNTAGLRANFAGSDLIVDIDPADPRKKLIQVKTGYKPAGDKVYLTQCGGEHELTKDKFVSDFVVFVNMDRKAGQSHQHNGELDFQHLTYYVVPRGEANELYRAAVKRDYDRLIIKTGERRKLGNMAVNVCAEEMQLYKDAWDKIREMAINKT